MCTHYSLYVRIALLFEFTSDQGKNETKLGQKAVSMRQHEIILYAIGMQRVWR